MRIAPKLTKIEGTCVYNSTNVCIISEEKDDLAGDTVRENSVLSFALWSLWIQNVIFCSLQKGEFGQISLTGHS